MTNPSNITENIPFGRIDSIYRRTEFSIPSRFSILFEKLMVIRRRKSPFIKLFFTHKVKAKIEMVLVRLNAGDSALHVAICPHKIALCCLLIAHTGLCMFFAIASSVCPHTIVAGKTIRDFPKWVFVNIMIQSFTNNFSKFSLRAFRAFVSFHSQRISTIVVIKERCTA